MSATMVHNEKYKLIYLNARGRAEPIRLIFAAVGVPFEDFRLNLEDWPKCKDQYPWGKLPVLEINGEVLAGSTPICRYLGRKFNLAGANELESVKCDEYVDATMDCRSHWQSYIWERESSPEKKFEIKQHFLNVQIPRYFGKFEKILESSNSGFLLGSSYTWADLHIAQTVTYIDEIVEPGLLDGYPKLKHFAKTVFDIPNVKAWIEERPKTDC